MCDRSHGTKRVSLPADGRRLPPRARIDAADARIVPVVKHAYAYDQVPVVVAARILQYSFNSVSSNPIRIQSHAHLTYLKPPSTGRSLLRSVLGRLHSTCPSGEVTETLRPSSTSPSLQIRRSVSAASPAVLSVELATCSREWPPFMHCLATTTLGQRMRVRRCVLDAHIDLTRP